MKPRRKSRKKVDLTISRQEGSIVIECCGLSKEYGEKRILRGARFQVGGGVHTLLGPNGAGKSTLLGILSFQIEASEGYFLVEGRDSRKVGDRMWMQRQIGVLGHRSFLSRGLTLRENLQFVARMYGIDVREGEIEAAGKQVGLEEKLDREVGEFSRGQLQRASFARALLPQPRILLLDEPTTGLDPQGTRLLSEILSMWQEKGEGCVLMTTHDLGWAAEQSRHFLVLAEGRLQGDHAGRLSSAGLQAFYEETLQGMAKEGKGGKGKKKERVERKGEDVGKNAV